MLGMVLALALAAASQSQPEDVEPPAADAEATQPAEPPPEPNVITEDDLAIAKRLDNQTFALRADLIKTAFALPISLGENHEQFCFQQVQDFANNLSLQEAIVSLDVASRMRDEGDEAVALSGVSRILGEQLGAIKRRRESFSFPTCDTYASYRNARAKAFALSAEMDRELSPINQRVVVGAIERGILRQ